MLKSQHSLTLCTLLFTLSFGSPCFAQADQQPLAPSSVSEASPSEEFFDNYFHTYNSDYQYYFMRKSQRLTTGLASVSLNQQQSGATDAEVKAFLPVYHGETFSFVLPFYFYRFPIAEPQQKGLPFETINNFFWQAVFNLKLSKDLQLGLITESHSIGTESSQFSLVGSDIAEFIVLKWDISPTLTLAPAARGKIAWNDKNERQYEFTPAGHLIWRPTPELSLMTGLPSLFGLEWDGPWQLDLATHVMLGEGNINLMGALRKGWGRHMATTLRLIRDGYEDIYVPSFERQVDTQNESINQISQYKTRLQMELEFYPTTHSMFHIKAGYGFDEGIRLGRDDTQVDTIKGENGAYAGITFTTFYNLD